MWLTTPRFLAGLLVLAGACGLATWAHSQGWLDLGQAKAFYAAAALAVMAGVVWRARARWAGWWSR